MSFLCIFVFSIENSEGVNIMKTKSLLKAAVAGTLMVGALGSAQALDFYYQAGGGFVTGSAPTFPSIGYDGNSSSLDPGTWGPITSTISWGTPQDQYQSGAVINSTVLPPGSDPHAATGNDHTGYLTVGGAAIDFGHISHINNVIDESWTVGKPVQVSYNLWLDEVGMGNGGLVYKWNGLFEVLFTETPNDGTCEHGNPMGTICDDLFTYSFLAGDPTTFSFNGNTYNIGISGFYNGAGALTGTFYSGEDSNSTGWVQLNITQVPEPATITLMALGLAGLGFLGLRRRES